MRRVVGLRGSMQQLTHEADVGDGQPQGLDAGQPLLVGKGRDLEKDKSFKNA